MSNKYVNVTELSVMVKDELKKEITNSGINKLLISIGFLEYIEKAYSPISEYGILKERDGYSFCVWNTEIIEDQDFIDAINNKGSKPLKKGITISPKKEAIKEGDKYDKKYLTFSQISKDLDIPSKDIKNIFENLGYYKQDGKNEILLQEFRGKTISSEKYGNTYILWDDAVLENVHLKKGKKVSTPSMKKNPMAYSKPKSIKTSNSSIYIEVDRDKWTNEWHIEYGRLLATGTDIQIKAHEKKKPKSYRTDRGDTVPSKNELSFVNFCFSINVPYILGTVVKEIDEVIVSDLYIPYRYIKDNKLQKLDVYCEYWGDLGDAYDKNKERKRALSKKHGFILMEFPSSTSEDMTTRFERIFNSHPAIKATGMTLRELNTAHSNYKNESAD